MTDQEINIKIAGLCGWRPQTLCTDMQGKPWPSEPPNYTTDLNAIVEVCREQSDEIKALIAAALTVIVMGWSGGQPNLSEREDVENYRDFFDIMAATSQQWCEAFLRVHGQWEETE